MILYFMLSALLFVFGLHGVFACTHPLRKLLALNVMSGAAFLFLVTLARAGDVLDPVPHAMVLTGIVVTVSSTAVALVLVARLSAGRNDAGMSSPRRES